MKKLIAMLFVVSLCVPSIFAQGNEHNIYSVYNGSANVSADTITSNSAYVAYIIIQSTGVDTSTVVRLLNGGTTVFAFTPASASAETITVPLTNTSVLFSTSLIVDSSITNTAVTYNIVYRKRN